MFFAKSHGERIKNNRFQIMKKYKNIKLNGIILLFISILTPLGAQNELPISLEKVMKLAGANNLTIQQYEERQNLAYADVLKAKEWWLPNIEAGFQSHQLAGSVMNSNGKYFLDVNRDNFWMGLGLNMQWDIAKGIYASKASKIRNKATIYETQIEKNKAILQSINAYYDLIKAQLHFDAFKNLVGQSDSLVQELEIQVVAGLRYQSELLLAKSNRNHLKIKMLQAKNDAQLASSKLLALLNLEQNTKLIAIENQLTPLEYPTNLEIQDIENRPEIKKIKLNIDELEVKKNIYTKGLLIPNFQFGTDIAYNGRLQNDVVPIDPITYPNPQKLYPTQRLNARLFWKIPLGALIYNGDNKKYQSLIKIEEIEIEKNKTQFNKALESAKTKLKSGKEQIEIAKESVELSAEALNQSIQRQKLGTAKPFEVFQSQQFFLQSQVDYLEAVSLYNQAWFEWKVAAGENL